MTSYLLLRRRAVGTRSICGSVLIAWVAVAVLSQQSILSVQRSSLLMRYGAVDGTAFITHDWWRLVASQFLHVKPLHMLFNVGAILLIGQFIERGVGTLRFVALFFLSGTVGQLASVLWAPQLVTSGASQALMGLIGALIIPFPQVLRRDKLVAGVAVAVLLIQVALDVYVSRSFKPGHAGGLLAGCAIAVMWLAWLRLSAKSTDCWSRPA